MSIKKWIESFSPVTLTSAFSSVTLGFAVAWYKTNKIDPLFYIITLLGILAAQAGVNLINDYTDYKSGVDMLYRKSGFFHRPNAVLDLDLPPSQVKNVGYFLLGIALVCGIYLAVAVGIPIIIIGIIGIFLGIAYSEPPFKLKYRGLGELIAGITMGPLVVWGSFVVQTGDILSLYPLLVGIINGAFTFLILLGSSSLKMEASRELGKKTIVLVLGLKKLRYAVYSTIIVMYLSLVISALLNYLPLLSLISLVLVPRTVKLSSPLLSGSEEYIKSKWKELRKLWAGPFSVRLIILIIILLSIIITRELHIFTFAW
ncbi:MAG: prenyltransferase [Caldisphaera sp.]|jgi:1,4-dihydroxy-2-naphthoate octaprenyltransferase